MTSVQERLQIKREPIDKWSIREQLCLASAVARSGDQNWMSVSRALKPFGDSNRPQDWFHQKNCAAQYGSLLENVETPKRKKRTSSAETSVETPTESILKKLTRERLAELEKMLAEEKAEYKKLQEDMVLLQSGNVSEDVLDQWCKQIDEEERQREEEIQVHNKWLKEREKRKQEIERAWRPLSKTLPVAGQKRKASEGIDSLLENEQHEEQQQAHQSQVSPQDPSKPALSPLLTSLLKSPSHSQNIATSLLHSAITSTSNRNASSASNPTIASLLNSTACVTVSPGIQHLVSSAISQTPSTPHTTTSNTTANLSETNAVDILEDAVDSLPNLKVEDIESTILSSDEPLPEIKNEEVEVIISDLIQNADIVDNPEQHLPLDDNEDIITNLDNELQELYEKEELAEAARAAAAAADTARATSTTTSLRPSLQPVLNSEMAASPAQDATSVASATATTSRSSSSNGTPLSSDAVQEIPENSLSSPEIGDVKDEPETKNSQDNEETRHNNETKEKENEKTVAQIDPYEFSVDIEISESLKPASFCKHQELRHSEVKEEEKRDVKSTIVPDVKEISVQQDEKKEIRKSTEEKLTIERHDVHPGSVEIVEVVELGGETIGKELNKRQIQDIVHCHKIPDSDSITSQTIKIEPNKDEDNQSLDKVETPKLKSERFSEDEENDLEVELQTQQSENLEKKEETPMTKLIEPKREETLTPDFSSSFLEDLEVNKLDKMGKAKRDYSRTKKKEDKDFDILLAVEKAVNAHLEDTEQAEDTSSENNYYDNEKKPDVKYKVKNENDRSSSPWTEEEDFHTLRSRRRASATATPIDSIPGSPASSFTLYEDDRDYKNWKKSVMLVYNRLATHKNASIFWKPITDDQAPGYHGIVRRPMDLQTIRKNIENGVIRTTSEFYRDVLVMFTNAIMYNKSDCTVFNMAKDMQQESLQPIKILMQAQQGLIPPKRETRTSESGNKRKRQDRAEDNLRCKKRKED